MPTPFRRIYKFSVLNSAAHRATDWIGSVQSLMVHTLAFAVSFALVLFGFDFEKVLLVVTTLVSLEAIYLAIFIQMAINHNSQSLDAVEEDIDEIQKDVDEIQKDVDEIEGDIDEIQEDIDEIEQEETEEEKREKHNALVLDKIEGRLTDLVLQIEKMKSELR